MLGIRGFTSYLVYQHEPRGSPEFSILARCPHSTFTPFCPIFTHTLVRQHRIIVVLNPIPISYYKTRIFRLPLNPQILFLNFQENADCLCDHLPFFPYSLRYFHNAPFYLKSSTAMSFMSPHLLDLTEMPLKPHCQVTFSGDGHLSSTR